MNNMVTVLYTRKNSIYDQLNTDTWDINRDARQWPGGNTIIAHPPCRAWGNYSQSAKPRHDEKQLAIHAIIMVRLWGGILEHPARSKLWQTMHLPRPGKQPDQYGGWTLNINQKWFGHQANKNTNLYIVGCTPKNIPPIPITLHQKVPKTIENMSKPQRERTPEQFAIWLITLAEICKKNKKEQIAHQINTYNFAQ